MTKKTNLEKIMGSPVTESITTLIGTAGALTTPFAVLLPVLTNSIAGQRQQKRIECALDEINTELTNQKELLKNLSDEQYFILTESITEIFQTINKEKIKYLKRAIFNSPSMNNLDSQRAVSLSRIIRDISAEEALFTIENSLKYTCIHVTNNPQTDRNDTLYIPRNSPESLVVSGLESLGVLEFHLGTMGDGNILCFSSITNDLISLLR
jgi:hypothetical protein